VDLVGEMEGSFGTSFGTLGRDDLANGTARLTGSLRGRTVTTRVGGATAGWETNTTATQPRPSIHLFAIGTDGIHYHMWIGIDPQYFTSGSVVSLDQGGASGWTGFWNPGTNTWTNGGSVANGQVRLDKASLEEGGAVSGRISGWVVEW
jgi:hypothetical protein